MSERIKNFKLFQKTLAIVCAAGALVTVFTLCNNPNNYHKNKDKYNYNVELSYDKINDDRILAGEEIYLSDDEYALYENTIPLRIIKKINRLSYSDSGFKEATAFYEAKYSEEVALSNEASRYKKVKTELVKEFLDKHLSDKKYLTTSNVYLLSSKEDFDYIKEVVYFIDTATFELKTAIEIDSKYNHKEDLLEYANYKELSESETLMINEKLRSSITIYNSINDIKENLKKNNTKLSQVFIYDADTVILYKEDNSTTKESISNL